MMSGVPLETRSAFKKNFGIINSITMLHLVGISTESSTMHGSMSIEHSCIVCVMKCNHSLIKPLISGKKQFTTKGCKIVYRRVSI